MPFDSAPGEQITRFLLRDQVRADSSVRHSAFQPPKTGLLSIYHTQGLDHAAIWELGDTFVAPRRGPITVRADLNSLAVYAVDLRVDIDGVPHARHGNVVGWDFSTADRLRAQKLAEAAGTARFK